MLAANNAKIEFSPIMKFYVVRGPFEMGEIVDFRFVTSMAAAVDFSSGPGAEEHFAVVALKSDGEFEVKSGREEE